MVRIIKSNINFTKNTYKGKLYLPHTTHTQKIKRKKEEVNNTAKKQRINSVHFSETDAS